MAPRYKKVIRDLIGNKSRTVVVVLAIAIGVFAFGSVFITQEVLLANLENQYRSSSAANVSIYLSDFDSTLIDWAARQPGVGLAAGKVGQTTKLVLPSGKEETISLVSVPDYSEINLNKIVPKKGVWPPEPGELVLERNSISGTKLALGDTVTVKTKSGRDQKIVVTGSVYDNSAFPYVFTRQMTGYVSWSTLGSLGYPKRYNQLIIKTGVGVETLEEAEKATYDITESLRGRGVEVFGTQVSKPNQHWATDNSKAFTAILSIIGVFSLVLSGFLVINTISALLAQQKKQIGIMKAVGARRGQIVSLYLLMVGFYGLLSLVIALPLGMLMGYGFLALIADFLNLDIQIFYLPTSVLFMELAAALAVPTVAALIPIFAGTRKSVREAITDFSVGAKVGLVDRLIAKISWFGRPTLIAIRNSFRKKGRLALTLGTLVTAGALFISVINVRDGMFKEMDRILAMYDFEVNVQTKAPGSADSIIGRIVDVPGVVAVEARTSASLRRIKPDGTKGPEFVLSGLPPDTPFSHPVVLSGRWLAESDHDKVVLSSVYQKDNPDLSVGDTLEATAGGDKHSLEIVGVIAASGEEKINFSDFGTVAQINDRPNVASSFLVKTSPDDTATQNTVSDAIKDKLENSGIAVASRTTKSEIYAGAASQFNFLIFFLLTMAMMVAVVGGLGLAGTMSLNVMERTREIGIMRSIGAGDGEIRRLVLLEGLLVGFISWIMAIPLSLPLTYMFCYALGNAFFGRTLVLSVIPMGMLIWLAIVFLLSVFASLLPARRASKMSISETLSYE